MSMLDGRFRGEADMQGRAVSTPRSRMTRSGLGAPFFCYDARLLTCYTRLLRTRRERPSGYAAAEKCEEFPPPHGLFSKARDYEVWRLGVLQGGAPPEPLLEATKDGLRDLGYAEGRNITFEVRWAEGKVDRFPDEAAELVDLKVDAIHSASTPAALAARSATGTIPDCFLRCR